MSLQDDTKLLQRFAGVTEDGIYGLDTAAALIAKLGLSAPVSQSEIHVVKATSFADPADVEVGDGTWPWTAEIDGEDIVVRNARATCFGGSGDPQDDGSTASGISTKDPSVLGCALPMDGRMFTHLSPGEHMALDGSPIPRMPWKTPVCIQATGGMSFEVPVIDLGPNKHTGNAIDLTIAAARLIDPNATATNFEARVDYRIAGGAKYLPAA